MTEDVIYPNGPMTATEVREREKAMRAPVFEAPSIAVLEQIVAAIEAGGRAMTCRSCQHAKWQYTATGRISKKDAGRCQYEIQMPPVPWCVHDPSRFHKSRIWPGDGVDCPVYFPAIEAGGER